ncbi:hypothetical protein ACPPVO_13750 [Dactylosporangium sp. McL0621]|uniref:hypothetical protein n=1 Tax=Dactylosporangium sp. McL0621 TaxID=3415678 RepID=UPI003CEEE94E
MGVGQRQEPLDERLPVRWVRQFDVAPDERERIGVEQLGEPIGAQGDEPGRDRLDLRGQLAAEPAQQSVELKRTQFGLDQVPGRQVLGHRLVRESQAAVGLAGEERGGERRIARRVPPIAVHLQRGGRGTVFCGERVRRLAGPQHERRPAGEETQHRHSPGGVQDRRDVGRIER